MASNEVVSGLSRFRKPLQFLSKKKKRTYIMPSRFGVAFGAMALVLFFLAVGYANNLIYIFVFFLISVAVTGILLTNKNMDIVRVEGIESPELFAKEEGRVRVDLENNSDIPAWEVEAVFAKSKDLTERISLAPKSQESLFLRFTPLSRGYISLPRITLQSVYPFGLLRAWKYAVSEQKILIFPQRRGDVEFPVDSVSGEGMQQSGLFRDHRTFQSADPLSRIDWRASARRQELLVKNYEEPEKPALSFSWEQTAYLEDPESRISQLCLWVDQAAKQGYSYSLTVGSKEHGKNSGAAHRQECLKTLALLQTENLP
ncbi:DUF58 domain-containing protein [Bdellovibrio bacteriovorus]|uniref:DUF58 domain-containing protein n=1 Tax=Bdellovibrio bacteriovorus TaxID=959 RepID=UPI0021D273E7|nr:DUF58 domain-containing protein [Bdellovibrio bacteriovorus]UXR65770.1 DUF58 domain-containing protein [Bdellovibrio bacteriovorus]